MFNAKTKVIYISEEEKLSDIERENLHNLLEISNDEDFELNWLPKTHSKAETIMEYVYKEHLDILAIYYYKHNFISNLFREQVVKEITYHIRALLLILPSID